MSKTVSKFALTAGLVLAMAFTLSCSSGDDSSAFVGKWVKDDGSESVELFKDGTGIAKEKKKGKKDDMPISISWKVVDKRFVMTMTVLGSLASQAYDYEISDKKITLIDDNGKSVYVKPQEGKIEGKILTDNRDGKKYKTVIIGTQTWMAENLNYENIEGNDSESNKCYNNDSSNCQKYGRLYAWYLAEYFCPYGWHLPSKAEWTKLTGFVGNNAETKLQATYGFSALSGGYGNSTGSFFEIDSGGNWWSATEYNSNKAYHWSMDFNKEKADLFSNDKSLLLSVRCVQDEVKPVGNYKGGKEHGEWKFFHENGNLKSTGNFIDSKEHGEWKFFHENGNLKSTGNFIDSKEHGEWKFFYENGNLETEGNYIDGKEHGEWKWFYENGNLEMEGNFKDGKKQGEWKYFYKNGKSEKVENYKDGVLQ